MDTRVSRV